MLGHLPNTPPRPSTHKRRLRLALHPAPAWHQGPCTGEEHLCQLLHSILGSPVPRSKPRRPALRGQVGAEYGETSPETVQAGQTELILGTGLPPRPHLVVALGSCWGSMNQQ